MSTSSTSPIYAVKAVPIEQIDANDYNPNRVAPPELKLLAHSIRMDGYTLPVVCRYDSDTDRYTLVDGYHRYLVMLSHKDIYDREQGRLPVITLSHSTTECMASTVRHNRARGIHSITLTIDLITRLKRSGVSDDWLVKQLGCDVDELLRLKQLSGLPELFGDHAYSPAWGKVGIDAQDCI